MGLSRLDNLLKNARGTILYVDPANIDSTDSIENQGNSPTRPFKTIQRALIEASRFSYQGGKRNDRFNKTSIMLYPGDHIVDNRPGWIPDGAGTFRLRSSATSSDLKEFDLTTNLDLTSTDNNLYKLNSIYGGVIVPRGTSIIGMDLRKTKIRPTYVPNPDPVDGESIERSAVFRITGASYFWQFTILDADPNGFCYKDYNPNVFIPNFSHHKLTGFEYVDGVNPVKIDDGILEYTTDRTDLDMYYEKIGIIYGESSGRQIPNDYPSDSIDIEKKVDEYRIVGEKDFNIGITSIRSGDGGLIPSTTITAILDREVDNLSVDTPINIKGVNATGYEGQYVISDVIDGRTIQYKVLNIPQNVNPDPDLIQDATLKVEVDSTSSASPYIFNVSIRSVFGMCGMLADGSKVTGFKSMVVAQFTGIGLQKDDNAFTIYDKQNRNYLYSNDVDNLHINPEAKYRPEYRNYHIKSINDAYIQTVSVFAIGYAEHFVTENGGDQSINNSNSNFGAKALVAKGFKQSAYSKDDVGYITHIIPPKELESTEQSVEFLPIDVDKTANSAEPGFGITSRLYLYNETNFDKPPSTIIDGYRLGSKYDDKLNIVLNDNTGSNVYSAHIIMQNTEYGEELVSKKTYEVLRKSNNSENDIVNNLITLKNPHSLLNGESIRIISENGDLPDGISPNQIYYTITGVGIGSTQLKIAQTLEDALSSPPTPLTLNDRGGVLRIESRVSDKKTGDLGHPVQWDTINQQWYITVGTALTSNTLYTQIVNSGVQRLGAATPRSFITRKPDTRNILDTIYTLRYVIPKDCVNEGRPPLDGFVFQESSSGIGTGSNEISKYFNVNAEELLNSNDVRNFRFISTCTYDSNKATVISELPHNLAVGDHVEILNVTSTNNSAGISNSGYNGSFVVTEISNSRTFSYDLLDSPGNFTNNINNRTENLPRFSRKKYKDTFVVYRTKEIQKFIPGPTGQDGIYHLIVVNSSNSPTVIPFRDEKFYQPIQNLYPQLNRDNPNSDPEAATSFALPDVIGQVVVDEPQNSITKENLNKLFYDMNVGFGITDIQSNTNGINHVIYTERDHNLCGITSLSILSPGSGYSNGIYYDVALTGNSQTGKHATAKVTVSGGVVTEVLVIHPGSSYSVGNQLSISINGNSSATFRVEKIYDHVGETLSITGIAGTFKNYNNLYTITGISTGDDKRFNVISSNTISNITTTGISNNVYDILNFENCIGKLTGKTLTISSFSYNSTTGLASIGFTTSHGLKIDNKLKIGTTRTSESNQNIFNTDVLVKKIISPTNLIVKVGIVTTSTSISIGGSEYVYPYFFAASGGDLKNDTEKTSGRIISFYDGISSVLTDELLTTNPDPQFLNIKDAKEIGLKQGDYLQIQDEIFRIKSPVTGNSVAVFRSILGSPRQSHYEGYVVRKIKVFPIEFRRNSVIRASSHTFEYLGFGPGNYSTSLPENQPRKLTGAEEILSQSTRYDGGLIVFTGMNNDGDFYVGNKKVSSATGQEEVFDTPIPTVTGEDIIGAGGVNVGFDVLTPLEVSISRSIRVEGGPDANVISEFDGPVLFNNKITSTSDKGIEANSVFIQGDTSVSRKFTVSKSKPTLSGNPGDIVTKAEPTGIGDFIGWTYALSNEWIPFGSLGGNGIGISSNGTNLGFSTSINIIGNGIDVGLANVEGNTTFSLTSRPRVGISTGLLNTYTGIATQINFVGYGITIRTATNPNGVTTVFFDGSAGLIDLIGAGTTEYPGGAIKSIQYNKDGLQWGGLTGSQYNDISNVLTLTSKLNYNLNTSLTAINILQTGTGDILQIDDRTSDTTPFILKKSGSIGIGIANPAAKLHIYTIDSPGVLIQVPSGNSSYNPLEVQNSANDTTPFVVNYQGNVGINTGSLITGVSLDVVGTTAVSGEFRIYESDRSNYVGLRCPSIGSNLTFTLPSSYGNSGQVLTSNGSGILSWRNVSNQEVTAGTGIRIQYTTVGTGLTIAQIFNTGIRNITAGNGVVVTNTAEGEVTISAVIDPSPYPFTTLGFSYVL